MHSEETPARLARDAAGGSESSHDLARVIIGRKAKLIREAAKAACFHPDHVDELNYSYAIRQLQQTIVEMAERHATDYEQLANEVEDWRERHGSRP